ncbi:MAG: hypothetical protein Q9161_006891 [Pseudevernia consocians]
MASKHLRPLDLPEILKMTFVFLDGKSLFACAQVNSLWANEATDLLWTNSPNFALANLLSSGRAQVYADKTSRLESLPCIKSKDSRFLQAYSHLSFPRLTKLSLALEDVEWLPQYLQPSLRVFKMECFTSEANRDDRDVNQIYMQLSTRCPHLREVIIGNVGLTVDGLLRFLETMPSIRNIKLRSFELVTENLMQYLAARPNLERLHIPGAISASLAAKIGWAKLHESDISGSPTGNVAALRPLNPSRATQSVPSHSVSKMDTDQTKQFVDDYLSSNACKPLEHDEITHKSPVQESPSLFPNLHELEVNKLSNSRDDTIPELLTLLQREAPKLDRFRVQSEAEFGWEVALAFRLIQRDGKDKTPNQRTASYHISTQPTDSMNKQSHQSTRYRLDLPKKPPTNPEPTPRSSSERIIRKLLLHPRPATQPRRRRRPTRGLETNRRQHPGDPIPHDRRIMVRPTPIRRTDHPPRKLNQHLPIQRTPVQGIDIKRQGPEAEDIATGDELRAESLEGGQGGFLVEVAQGLGGGDDGEDGGGFPEGDGVVAPDDVLGGGLGGDPVGCGAREEEEAEGVWGRRDVGVGTGCCEVEWLRRHGESAGGEE